MFLKIFTLVICINYNRQACHKGKIKQRKEMCNHPIHTESITFREKRFEICKIFSIVIGYIHQIADFFALIHLSISNYIQRLFQTGYA